MIRTTAHRVVVAFPTLVVVMLITFALLELMPGDPAAIIAGDDATAESIDSVRQRLGLDRPVLSRFGSYLTDALEGDLGTSLITGRSVSTSISGALAPTVSLAVISLGIVLLAGFAGGVAAALHRGGLLDRLVNSASALGLAVPPFVIAIALIIPFSLNRNWFPATGYAGWDEGFWEWLQHLLLPAIALAVNSTSELARQVRAALVDTMQQDFILTARANGLSRWAILAKHAMKNSMAPIVTVFGLQVGRILGAAVVVESVFAIPGFGLLAFSSVLRRDIPMVQGIVLVSAVVVLVTNLLVDLLYPLLNPKLRR